MKYPFYLNFILLLRIIHLNLFILCINNNKSIEITIQNSFFDTYSKDFLFLEKGLNIALHAQANYINDKFVVGSEITCNGFKDAFLRLNPKNNVIIFHPSNYSLLTLYKWDIVFIEGWVPSIRSFIHEIRNKIDNQSKIYFYCLDPYFPGLSIIKELDVDGFFTNSKNVYTYLNTFVPTTYMLLASKTNENLINHKNNTYNVVFIGSVLGMETKYQLKDMLNEAKPFGLTIYGNGWNRYPEYADSYKGVLESDKLLDIYCSSKVVLGLTMDKQREAGMINNRVFEALSCGVDFISDYFIELKNIFGNLIHYYYKKGDVTNILSTIFNNITMNNNIEKYKKDRINFIKKYHTYNHRIIEILKVYNNDIKNINNKRKNKWKFGIILDELNFSVYEFLLYKFTIFPGINQLNDTYSIRFFNFSYIIKQKINMTELINTFQIFLVITSWKSKLNQYIINQIGLYETPCYKIIYLLRPLLSPLSQSEFLFYDLFYYTDKQDYLYLKDLRTNSQFGFGMNMDPIQIQMDRSENESVYDVITFGSLENDDDRILDFVLNNEMTNKSKRIITTKISLNRYTESYHIIKKKKNINIIEIPSDMINLLQYLSKTKSIYFPGKDDSGGKWLLILASYLGIKTIINDHNKYLNHIKNEIINGKYQVPNFKSYISLLRTGLTRVVCLGRSNATIQIEFPKNNSYIGMDTNILFRTNHFKIQYDGIVCLYVNDELVYCLQQSNLHFILHLDNLNERIRPITIRLALRSIIYGNIIYFSPYIHLFASTSYNQKTNHLHLFNNNARRGIKTSLFLPPNKFI